MTRQRNWVSRPLRSAPNDLTYRLCVIETAACLSMFLSLLQDLGEYTCSGRQKFKSPADAKGLERHHCGPRDRQKGRNGREVSFSQIRAGNWGDNTCSIATVLQREESSLGKHPAFPHPRGSSGKVGFLCSIPVPVSPAAALHTA